MNYREKYEQWLTFDEETKAELLSITDEKEIEDRFYKDLAFGTGGLRGIMGAGSNRMNKYTVGKATYGLAKYLMKKHEGEEIKVALAYDSRNNSAYFAKVAAGIFASCGFKVFLYEMLVPVPVLSFTTAFLGCTCGVMLTASHNPKEYNGYKVYDNRGCQFCTEDAKNAIGYINDITDFSAIPFSDSMDNITMIGEDVLSEFLKKVKEQSLYEEKSDLKIVYTPLHGTGNIPVRRMLEGMNVTVVKEQEMPDGNFSKRELLEPIVHAISSILKIDCSSLEIINRPPTRSKPIYMKVWEARKADGLEYDENDERQQLYLAEITKYNIKSIG